MIELKPCPFCGMNPDINNPDTLYQSGIWWKPTEDGIIYAKRTDSLMFNDTFAPCWSFHCVESAGGCGLELPALNKREAIEAWNRRV